MEAQAALLCGPGASGSGPVRLLLPLDATPRSRWGIDYAARRKGSGHRIAVALLFVAEPVANLHGLRFRTQEAMRRMQATRGDSLLVDAAAALEQAGIPVQNNYREGDATFQILDVAEQLQCHEIVLPLPHPRWSRMLSRDIVREVLRRQRGIPVTTVGPGGIPQPGA